MDVDVGKHFTERHEARFDQQICDTVEIKAKFSAKRSEVVLLQQKKRQLQNLSPPQNSRWIVLETIGP